MSQSLSYVYLLRHASEPRFKIGKTNDIHQRILNLGGFSEFDIRNSYFLQFAKEKHALKTEKILHRLFNRWNLPTNEKERYIGDTEQFSIECFDRIIQYLGSNSDLIYDSKPISLSNFQFSINYENKHKEREIKRKLELERRWEKAFDTYNKTINLIDTQFQLLEKMELDKFIIENGLLKIETTDPDEIKTCLDIVGGLICNSIPFGIWGGHSFIFGATSEWDGNINKYVIEAEIHLDGISRDLIERKWKTEAWIELDTKFISILEKYLCSTTAPHP